MGRRRDALPALGGQVPACPAHQLTGVGLARLQDLGDPPVGVVERLPQHVGGALHGIQLLQEQQNRHLQGLGPLRAQLRILRGVDGLGKPGADIGLPAHPCRLRQIDRQPGGHRGQEGGRFEDLRAVRVLPPQPGFLHDVLGLHRTAQDAVGDAEESRARRKEVLRRLIEGVGAAASVHGSSLLASCAPCYKCSRGDASGVVDTTVPDAVQVAHGGTR